MLFFVFCYIIKDEMLLRMDWRFLLWNMKKIWDLYTKYDEVINYLIAGGCSTIVNVASYTFFAHILFLNYQVSTVLSWILAVLFAFLSNKLFVFRTKRENYKAVVKEAFDFFKFRIATLVIEMILMWLFIDTLHLNDIISKIIIQFVVIALNYVFSKLFIFKQPDQQTQ